MAFECVTLFTWTAIFFLLLISLHRFPRLMYIAPTPTQHRFITAAKVITGFLLAFTVATNIASPIANLNYEYFKPLPFNLDQVSIGIFTGTVKIIITAKLPTSLGCFT